MSELGRDGAPGQWAQGNQNVQIHTVAASATVSVSFGGPPRRVPLEPAIVPLGGKVRSAARLLGARSGALPFLPAAGLMAGLEAWMAGPEPFSVYLIGGRGGSGKTRLGVELCRVAESKGWLCGLLQGAAEQAAVEVLAEVPTARLVVVDYAESRAEQLEVLLPILAQRATAEHPVRALLLVRASPSRDDWAEPLRGRGDWLDTVLDETEKLILDDRPLTLTQRRELFTATATAFTDRQDPHRLPGTVPVPDPPPELGELVFATPLQVVAAAYLAVHGTNTEGVPTTREGLLVQLTVHEDRYWQSTATSLGIDQGLRRRVMAAATLAGADTEAEATQMLQLVPDLTDATAERRGRLARWAHNLYPGPRWWNPLEPDLLGEHLVATHFAEYPGVLAGVLQRQDPSTLIQPLGLSARAAADYPAFAAALQPILTAALPGLCQAAVREVRAHTDLDLLLGTTTVAAALNRAVATIPIDAPALFAAHDVLPRRPDLILGPLALTLTDQLVTAFRSLAKTDPATSEPYFAKLLTNLSIRLSAAGRRSEALSAAEEAIDLYRRLARADPAVHTPGLARSLSSLEVQLAAAGRRPEALSAAQEAVKLYRRLVKRKVTLCRRVAKKKPAVYNPDLAGSLNNLSHHLAAAGRRPEALSAAQEAVKLYRRLARAEPAAYNPDLAMSLSNLSIRLAGAGRRPEALSVAQEAVTLRRPLARAEPAAYNPDLARSLNNLSNQLSQAGHYPEALETMQEAVKLYRRLARAEPAAYNPDLAMSLNNLSHQLYHAGRSDEALKTMQEAVDTYRRLARAEPAAYNPYLAVSLHNLSHQLPEAAQQAEAELAKQKAKELRRNTNQENEA